MTPAQHATAALTEATTDLHSTAENDLAAIRAQAHAVLSRKAGTGTRYTDAEAALTRAADPTQHRIIEARRAIALATLAD